jgi:signal transduction histidine kinase
MQVAANNLVGNAIKYGKEGGKILLKSDNENGKVRIDVYNDSVPITEEQKEKLFKKFSRLQTAETKKVKGTGLGLYLTKQIIEKHGGSIWVEPRENGNSFIFEIERN